MSWETGWSEAGDWEYLASPTLCKVGSYLTSNVIVEGSMKGRSGRKPRISVGNGKR